MKKIIYQLKPVIAIQLIFHILYSLTNVALPELNKYLFDHIFQMGWTGLVWLLLAYALTIIANSVFQYISQVYEWKVSQGFYVTAKKGLANSLLSNFQRRMSLPIYPFLTTIWKPLRKVT